MAHTKNYRWACDQLLKHPYQLIYWAEFDYTILQYINKIKRAGSKRHGDQIFNDCFIMADTETSKKKKEEQGPNHVCAWSLAIRAYDRNIVCLYGTRPDEFCTALNSVLSHMPGDHTLVYFHNLAYDYVFLRKFLFNEFGLPESQLNVKPYYPISIKFDNGLELRDSLILAQCKLEKWADNLDVEHKKAVGAWDYEKIRDQGGSFSDDELLYIQNDVLAGVECLDALCKSLHKHVYSMPFTATGIPRQETRDIGKKHHAHELFKKCVNDWNVQMLLEMLFHGGYTHCNRNIAGWVQDWAECRDFTSSYPYSLISSKFPMGKFRKVEGDHWDVTEILSHADDYAYILNLSATHVRLKDPRYPMPMLQKSKLLHSELATEDNGRIMSAAFVSIMFNEYDLDLFLRMYDFDKIRITDVYYTHKDYLPRWFTDYLYQLFIDKSQLKGIDPINYGIAKSKFNACYGLSVQRPVRIDIIEDYESGLYSQDQGDNLEEKYKKWSENFNNILPYAWGVWCTSESMHRLYELADCIDYEHGGIWEYSDTDSVYASKWDEEKLATYNASVRDKLKDRGYGPVFINGKEFCLGVASFDGSYEEWVGLGAKRYCGRSAKDHELHITVSGVPKVGVRTLKNDIKNFKPGTVFDGITSGKKQHTYYMLEPGQDPYEDENGNLTGDSIDLEPCDYTLDSPYSHSWMQDLQQDYYELFTPELSEDYLP